MLISNFDKINKTLSALVDRANTLINSIIFLANLEYASTKERPSVKTFCLHSSALHLNFRTKNPMRRIGFLNNLSLLI